MIYFNRTGPSCNSTIFLTPVSINGIYGDFSFSYIELGPTYICGLILELNRSFPIFTYCDETKKVSHILTYSQS